MLTSRALERERAEREKQEALRLSSESHTSLIKTLTTQNAAVVEKVLEMVRGEKKISHEILTCLLETHKTQQEVIQSKFNGCLPGSDSSKELQN